MTIPWEGMGYGRRGYKNEKDKQIKIETIKKNNEMIIQLLYMYCIMNVTYWAFTSAFVLYFLHTITIIKFKLGKWYFRRIQKNPKLGNRNVKNG